MKLSKSEWIACGGIGAVLAGTLLFCFPPSLRIEPTREPFEAIEPRPGATVVLRPRNGPYSTIDRLHSRPQAVSLTTVRKKFHVPSRHYRDEWRNEEFVLTVTFEEDRPDVPWNAPVNLVVTSEEYHASKEGGALYLIPKLENE